MVNVMLNLPQIGVAFRVGAPVAVPLKDDWTPTRRDGPRVFANALAVMDAGQGKRNPPAFGHNSAPLTGSKRNRELVNDRQQDRMHRRDQAHVSGQEQGEKFREVLGVIELELDVERAVRRIPEKPLGYELRQLAIKGGDNRIALAVNANAVEPEMKIAVAGRAGATIVAEAIFEMLAIEDVRLVAVPDVEQVKCPIAAVRHELPVGAQPVANLWRQGFLHAAKQVQRVGRELFLGEHIRWITEKWGRRWNG